MKKLSYKKAAKKYCEVRGFLNNPGALEKWIERFKGGWEWQHSDYSGRRVLKELFPDIYPDDKDAFFHRPS